MSEDPSSSDSDVEYHTCDEEDDDESVHRVASPSSSSSDDGRDYYHTSDDDDDDDDDDVVHGAASVISAKKETHQLYTRNITGLDRHVQEILEICGQPEQIRRHVQTSTSKQDDCKFAVSTPNMERPLPLSRCPKDTLAAAGSGCRELIPTPRFEVDEETFSRQLVPTVDTLDQEGAAGGCNAPVLNLNVTEQFFRIMYFEKATNINNSFGGKQNISKTATYNEEGKGTKHSKTDLIMNRTMENVKSWNQGMVKTAVLEKVLDKVETGDTWLTIKGNPGEGKTTVGFMALEELYKRGRQVFEVRSPEEFSEVISTCLSPVIMLDDVFGSLEFDQSKWSSWEPVVSPLLKELEHKSHETPEMKTPEMKTPEKRVTVLLVGRDYVLNAALRDLGRLSDFLRSDKYVVSMNHSLTRNMEEKRAIWNSISKSSGVQLDERTIDEILKVNLVHGFPHVCRLYVTLYKENKEIKAKEFFEKPLEFLNISVSNLFKDANKMHLFMEMVKHGRIGMRELRRLDPTYKLIQAAQSMVGSFLRVEDDSVLFDHPSIYDSVAFHLCLLDPVFVIQQCNLGFIHDRVRLQMSQNESANSESSLVVYVDSSYADELAERFSSEIFKQNFYYVLSHQAFTDESFVSNVMSQVAMPFSKLLQLRDQTNSKSTFLRLVPSSKSPQVLKYLDNHPDIQLSEDDEKSICYGTFKHAAIHVLTYLIATRRSLNINVRFEYDCSATPLIIVAQTCDIQFIQQVLSLKPDLNASDESGRTALHYLCMNGLVSVVTHMLDSGAHINDIDNDRHATPLYVACDCNNLEMVKLLIKKGARVNRQTLNSVCKNGNIDILKFLLDEKMSLSENILTENYILSGSKYTRIRKRNTFPVHVGPPRNISTVFLALLNTSCLFNQPKVVEWLLKQNTDNDCQDKGQILFKSGATVAKNDVYGNSVLHNAAIWGSGECVGVFVAAGVDVNIRNVFGDTPLYKAVRHGHDNCVDLLLAAGTDVNIQTIEEGETALHHAAKQGNEKYVDLLLAAGADVNIQQNHGDTALHLAARRGSNYCVNVLLAAGANVNIQNEYGDTALHLAAGIGSKACVNVLLAAGANVNIQNAYGNKALHAVAHGGSRRSADLLLAAGANVNIQNEYGNTALHLAAGIGSKACVDVLLTAGADFKIRNKRGDMPVVTAARCGSKQCVSLLLRAWLNRTSR